MTPPSRPSLRTAGAAFAVALLCAACKPVDNVRIGFLGDVISELGVGGRNGAQLAIDTLNAEGGVHYELVIEDDHNDPQKARAAVATFAAQHAAFIVGPMTSTMAMAAVPEANRLDLVMISPTATTDALTGKDDAFFRTAADAPAGARELARALRARGARSVVVLMDIANGAYTTSFGHAAAVEFLRSGGESASEIGYLSGKSLEVADAMERIDGSHPDAVVLVSSPSDAAVATQHLRRALPQALIGLSPWGANVQYLQVGGRAADGTIALQAVALDSPLPRMRDFVARYGARYGEAPTTPAVQSYEAVMMGVDAMKRRGTQTLRQTLAQPQRWPGLDGDFALDAHGDATRALHMTQVRDGHFVPFTP